MSGPPESPQNANTEQRRFGRVALLLRVVGVVDCLAVTVAFLPWSLIEQVHSLVASGELSSEPAVEYLVRSVSVLHAMFGALLVLLSRDVPRYAELIRGLAKLTCVAGVLLFVVDRQAGVPLWWAIAQSGGLVTIGVFLVVSLRVKPTGSGSDSE